MLIINVYSWLKYVILFVKITLFVLHNWFDNSVKIIFWIDLATTVMVRVTFTLQISLFTFQLNTFL